jgi:hypothetical protein
MAAVRHRCGDVDVGSVAEPPLPVDQIARLIRARRLLNLGSPKYGSKTVPA